MKRLFLVRHSSSRPVRLCVLSLNLLWFLLAGCERPDPQVTIVPSAVPIVIPPTPAITPIGAALIGDDASAQATFTPPPTPVIQLPTSTALPVYEGTPTPDPTRPAANPDTTGGAYATHSVSFGESLGYIAQLYGSTVEELSSINNLASTDQLFVGQILYVPTGANLTGPSLKLIPDSELVYGPAARGFDVRAFVTPYNGYLLGYQEEVEGRLMQGPEIVQLVADRYSVNPRLLVALLEYHSGWVTNSAVVDDGYPMGYVKLYYEGLYKQLSWAANELNWGYYGRAEAGITSFVLGGDGQRVAFASDINDGTAGLQNLLGSNTSATYQDWLQDVAATGFAATFARFFGNPFAYTVDPLWPAELTQPPLRLPWPDGETWYFTGGPHGGWAPGSAWAALDFVPAGEQLGCYDSDAWIIAMSDGIVTRSDFGGVVVDLDGDAYAGTGWAITYMHLASRDRVAAGTAVKAGDRLGHPSCEGGFSNGTHVHLSRTYNGRWVAADGPIPFAMGGWLSQGLGREYDGLLVRGEEVKSACECREEGNGITAGE